MRKSILIAIIATFIFTIVVIFGGQKVMHATSDYPFCGSCHAWDGAIAQTNLADTVHGASSPNGVKVRCTDCHLPHDSVLNYVFAKAKNGIAEGYTTLTKDPTKKDWINNREKARKKHTFDSSCIKCHENILDRKSVV